MRAVWDARWRSVAGARLVVPWRAMVRWPTKSRASFERGMRRDIGYALLFKLLALMLLWALFFSDTHQPKADAAAVARVLTGQSDTPPGPNPAQRSSHDDRH